MYVPYRRVFIEHVYVSPLDSAAELFSLSAALGVRSDSERPEHTQVFRPHTNLYPLEKRLKHLWALVPAVGMEPVLCRYGGALKARSQTDSVSTVGNLLRMQISMPAPIPA